VLRELGLQKPKCQRRLLVRLSEDRGGSVLENFEREELHTFSGDTLHSSRPIVL
jgi:hypothetical protein